MNRKVFSISLVAVSALLVSSASALPLNEHALGFHAFLGSDQQFINHTNAGVINTAAAGAKQVLGSPARNPHAAGVQTVEVSGFNNSVNDTTRCTVETWAPNGVRNTSITLCAGPAAGCGGAANGAWTRSAAFTVAQAPANTSYVVTCTLLPAGANRIQSTRVSP